MKTRECAGCFSKELGARCVLLSEETAVQFLRAAPEGSSLQVQVRRFLGDTSVSLFMPGEEFDPFDPGEEESEDSIRALLLRSAGEKYSYTNRGRVNRVRIQTGQLEHTMLYYTIAAMVLGFFSDFLQNSSCREPSQTDFAVICSVRSKRYS